VLSVLFSDQHAAYGLRYSDFIKRAHSALTTKRRSMALLLKYVLGVAMKIDDGFKRFTKHTKDECGFCVNCVLGLWGVSAPTKEQAENEARHYFAQYWSDGEYDHLINT